MSARVAGKRKYASSGHAYIGMKRVYGPMKKRRISSLVVPGYTQSHGYYGRFGSSRENPAEHKFHDVTVNDAVMAVDGVLQANSLNLIAQGITESLRIGRKCNIRSMQWRYTLSLNEVDAAATPGHGDTIRLIVYQDTQCNGAGIANITDVMETNNYQSFYNLSNQGRFKILLDRQHTLNFRALASDGAGVVSSPETSVNGMFSKKCNVPLEFDNTTGAITEIKSNNFGFLTLSAAGNTKLNSKFRFRFTDR